jgi:hypothetical protein
MKIIIILGFFFCSWLAHSFELNYRSLERREIQSYINSQFNSIEKNFFVLLGLLSPAMSSSGENNVLMQYLNYQKALPHFRQHCINPVTTNPQAGPSICQQSISELISSISQLDLGLQQLFLLNPMINNPGPGQLAITKHHTTPLLINLHFFLSTELHRYEVFLYEMNYVADLDPINMRWIGLEQFNGLKNLGKQMQLAVLETAMPYMKDDLTVFWQQFIDVMLEKSNAQEKREYWIINLFQLNLRINELFYSCERHKHRLDRQAYSICEDIHTTWNQILKSTLRFKK